ncbi:hypothetical protein [Priestia flexa]|uniref:hypothetical protein n=1 Tax=Priestia flexa TaxID=86664 RepID=UPI00249211A2|nr:hypothetical protein [Priestia flexa]
MSQNVQLYCNTNDDGKIKEAYSGHRIVPTQNWDYFFMIDKKTELNLDKFYVENGELKQIEDTTLIEVAGQELTAEQQLEEMKKQMEEMKKLIGSLTNS